MITKDYCNGDELVDWYNGYKTMRHKKQIDTDLLHAGWHPSQYWEWCMLEDEKKETEKLWKDE